MADVIVLRSGTNAQGTISDTDRAWAAGFFEGEGSTQIRYTTNRTCALYVSIAQVDKSPLVWLQNRWGGIIRFQQRRVTTHRDHNLWFVSSRRATVFLSSIRPFVVRKHVLKRIDLAVRFQNQKVNLGGNGSVAYRTIQHYYFDQMKKLNIRGAAADTDTDFEKEQASAFEQLELLL